MFLFSCVEGLAYSSREFKDLESLFMFHCCFVSCLIYSRVHGFDLCFLDSSLCGDCVEFAPSSSANLSAKDSHLACQNHLVTAKSDYMYKSSRSV